MDAGVVGSVVTVFVLLLFVAIVWWVYHRGNQQKFEDAANLPFRESAEDAGQRPMNREEIAK